MQEGQPKVAKGRQVAVLTAIGEFSACIQTIKNLAGQSVAAYLMAPSISDVEDDEGTVEARKTFDNSSSVLFNAVYIPCGDSMTMLRHSDDARKFIVEAFKHGRAIAATGEGVELVAVIMTGTPVKDVDAKASCWMKQAMPR